MTQFFFISSADMRWFFYIMPIVLCIFLPAVTMRLWAEDRRGNTLELLLTFPVRTHELVLGKYLASLLFYIIALLSTLPIPIMLAFLGKPDLGAIVCQYLGAVFMGSFFLALGIFISGFCRDQIVSFIVSMMACFGFFLLGIDFIVGSIDGWIPGVGSFLQSSLGLTQHFDAFQKGVVDNRDFLYFIIGTAIFLVLNGFWLETRLRPKARTLFSSAAFISVCIFMLFNFILVDIPVGRFDFTEGKIYTTSEATKEILRGLKAPVTVKFFVSPADKMPTGFKTLERDIRDKLDELRVSSQGKFQYKVFRMEAANVAKEGEETLERSIEKKGIRPFQVRSIEADEMGVKLIYSAISIAYKEKPEDIIPQITPQNLFDLEYTLMSKIYKMTLEEPPVVAIVAPYEERLLDPQLKKVLMQLGQREIDKYRDDEYELVPRVLEYDGYKTVRIRLTEEEPIPEDVDTLVIIEPERLNERQKFEVNRFLVNGGSVFLAVQNYDFRYSPFGRGGVNVSAEDKQPQINDLLQHWGLGVSKDFLMDTQMEVVSLSGGRFMGIFEISSPVKLPVQIKVVPEQMNKDISITSRLSTLLYMWGSALELDVEKIKEFGLESETLFTSSPHSWKVPYHAGKLTNQDITPPPTEELSSFPLALFVRGQFPDAFEGKEVPEWPKDTEGEESYEKPEEDVVLSPQPGKLILVGCSHMFTKDLFQKGGHMTFFLNSIDALTLGEQLIRIRSKQPIDRSIGKLSSTARAGWRLFTTFFVPLLLCIVGGIRVVMRKRAKWAYLKSV